MQDRAVRKFSRELGGLVLGKGQSGDSLAAAGGTAGALVTPAQRGG